MSVNFVVVNEIMIWYNIVRYYTCADLRPTRGRTISLANHAHPPEKEWFCAAMWGAMWKHRIFHSIRNYFKVRGG